MLATQGEGWIPPRSPTSQPENPGFRVIFGWPRSDPPRGEAGRHPWSHRGLAPKEVRPYLILYLDATILDRVGYRPRLPFTRPGSFIDATGVGSTRGVNKGAGSPRIGISIPITNRAEAESIARKHAGRAA